jgi:uncharacterized protein (TIGR03067 family)
MLAVLLTGCLVAQGSTHSPAADDKPPALDGKWKVIKVELRGEELPTLAWTIQAFEFKGQKVKLTESIVLKEETKEYPLKLDPKATPMKMDIGMGATAKDCIYKFQKDKLIISVGGKQLRPKTFDSKKDNFFPVFTLERAK